MIGNRTGESTSAEILQERPTALQATTDIALLIAASAFAFLLESWVRNQGLVTWGEDSRGVTAVLVGVVVAIALVFYRGGQLRDLGFVRPKRWWTVPIWIAGILAAYAAMQLIVPRLVGLLIDLPKPDLSRHAAIEGNLPAALTLALVLPFTASIPEEIIYRGFLLNRLQAIFGEHRSGVIAAITVQSLIFGSIHFGWGLGGVLVTTFMGLTWGTAYVLCGRNLWIMILAHSTGHLLLAAQLYLGMLK